MSRLIWIFVLLARIGLAFGIALIIFGIILAICLKQKHS